jgi:hypothetical protein
MPPKNSKSTWVHTNYDPPRSQASDREPRLHATTEDYKASKRINLLSESIIAHKSPVLDGVMVDKIADPSANNRSLNTKIKFDDDFFERKEPEKPVGDAERPSHKMREEQIIASKEDDHGRKDLVDSEQMARELQTRESRIEHNRTRSRGSDEDDEDSAA